MSAGMEEIWFSVNLCLEGKSWYLSSKREIPKLGALQVLSAVGFDWCLHVRIAGSLVGSLPPPRCLLLQPL